MPRRATLARRVRRRLLDRTPQRVRRVVFAGRRRECPVCGAHVRAFHSTTAAGRGRASCPVCGSRERHRFTWRVLAECTDLLAAKPTRVLHFAAERSIARRLRALPHVTHHTADLVADADVRVDITAIPVRDAILDVVLCSHVLEHVQDDRGALREIRRVLRPGGWALIQVPTAPWLDTFEDDTVTTTEERLRVFGQGHHVRVYGRDTADRFRAAGFDVAVLSADTVFDADALRRFGVGPNETAYRCTKPRA